MEITSLSSLKPFKFNHRIRVRICRTWRSIRFGAKKYSGLHYIMVNQQGTSIHGFMPEDQVEDMAEKPTQGQMYEIYQFSTRQHSYGLRVVENSVIVHFNGHTVFCKVAETIPPVPLHSFRLVQFARLAAEREAHAAPSSNAVLTDVYRCVKSIRPLHPQYIKSQNKTGVKCEVVLENLECEMLSIVFWGKLAREFDVDAITSLPSPVLAVFTGLKMTLYNNRVVANNYDHTCVLLNPPTAWTDAYKNEFCKPGDKTMIQGDFHIFETTEPNDTLSVLASTGLNPAKHKARSILCKGQIIKIGADGWWYRNCPERGYHKQCFKMEDLDDKYRCKAHGLQTPVPCFRVNTLIGDEFSDVTVIIMGNQAEQLFGSSLQSLRNKRVYITEQILPPELSAVIGQIHVFEVKGNTYGEWIAVAVGPSEGNVSVTPPINNAGTSPTTLPPDITLQTPEKTCVEPKRTFEHGHKTLFPETKKTRREIDEISPSSSCMQEKDKLD